MRYFRRWAEKMVLATIGFFLVVYVFIYVAWVKGEYYQQDKVSCVNLVKRRIGVPSFQQEQRSKVIQTQQKEPYKIIFDDPSEQKNDPILLMKHERPKPIGHEQQPATESAPPNDQKDAVGKERLITTKPHPAPDIAQQQSKLGQQPLEVAQIKSGPNVSPKKSEAKGAQQKQTGPKDIVQEQSKLAQQKQTAPKDDAQEQSKVAQQKQTAPKDDAQEQSKVGQQRQIAPKDDAQEQSKVAQQKQTAPKDDAQEQSKVGQQKQTAPKDDAQEQSKVAQQKQTAPKDDAQEQSKVAQQKQTAPKDDAQEQSKVGQQKQTAPKDAAQEQSKVAQQKQTAPKDAVQEQSKVAQQKQTAPKDDAQEQSKVAQQKQTAPKDAAQEQSKVAQLKQTAPKEAVQEQSKVAQQKQPGPNNAAQEQSKVAQQNPEKQQKTIGKNGQNQQPPKANVPARQPKKAQEMKLDDSIQIPLRPPLLPNFPDAQRNGDYLTNLIVLTTATSSYIDFTVNWLISVSRLGGSHPKFYIIAEDKETFEYFHTRQFNQMKTFMEKYVHVIKSPQLEENSTLVFDTVAYKNFVNKRPQYILDILNKGHDVLFCDVDIVWFERPYRFFNKPFDIFILEDQGPPDPTVLCAGFVMYKATNTTKQFMERWIAEIDSFNEPRPDQVVLNRLFQNKLRIRKPVPKLKYQVLDPHTFVSGHYYFNATWREHNPQVHPIILHNNWIVGHDPKVQRFKKIKKWFL